MGTIANRQKLDGRTKWSYSIGATGRDMAYTLVSMFLITYIQYTMNLTVAQFSVISLIIILCLFWDAFNDPMMGMIIENCHFKMGKYRPWILLGMILNVTVIILLFTVRPEGWGFVVFFGIGYLLWGMTYTMNDIAYWGMLPSLSSDPKERNTLVTLMSIFICIGQFSVAGLLPMFVAGNAVTAYKIAAIIIASCFFVFQLLTFFGVKERKRESAEAHTQLSLKGMFRVFGRNDQLIVIGIASLLYNIGSQLLIMFSMNFFYFEFGYEKGGGLIFIFTVMYGLGTLLSQSLFAVFTKYFTRKQLLTATTILIMAGYTALLLFGYVLPKNAVLLNIIGFLIFFAQGTYNLLIVVMLNNTVEYDEYRFHERHDSTISAVRSFTVKLASAINQGIIALVLIISGIYTISQEISALEIKAGIGELTNSEVLSRADEFIAQTDTMQTLLLRIGMVAFPIIAVSACFIVIRKKYVIDEKKYDELIHAIAEREESKS